jgi:UDP-glucose 4-epimerase
MVVFGNDYPTQDGTCIRDYVHVMDLADAIVSATLDKTPDNDGYQCIGSNRTFTNLQVLDIMKNVSGKDFAVEFGPRRLGDPAELTVESTSKYVNVKHTIEDMCRSAYEMELK